MNTKKIMGVVTISLIIGGTIYCIKKYKDSQNLEGVIDLEEAKAIVKMQEMKKSEDEVLASTKEVAKTFGMDKDEIEELIDDARDEVNWNASFDSGEPYDFYDGVDWSRPLSEYITEEDKVLRFEPNSIQARDHFIKMELAELLPGMREYQVMKRLFDFQFEPLNDGDSILHSQLMDYRIQFFGNNSRWNEDVSMADIITHYARLTDFNVGGGVGHWIIEFVGNTEFNELHPASSFEYLIVKLNRHKLGSMNIASDNINIFGLSFDDLLDAEEMAEQTVDGEVTYEIEFNTFLKNCV